VLNNQTPLTPEDEKRLAAVPQKPADPAANVLLDQPGLSTPATPESKADYTPGRGAREALRASGWKLPAGAKKDMPKWMLDQAAEQRSLHKHDYMLSNQEASMMEELLAGKPGFGAPDQDFAGLSAASGGEVTSQALTWEAYNKLNPQAKAAIDFNTALIEAREADFKINGEVASGKTSVDDKVRSEYDTTVKKLFGDQRGSDVYAPNTVNLLKDIDLTAVGQDLDEFLSLERGVALDELRDVTKLPTPQLPVQAQGGGLGDVNEFAQVRSAENQNVVTLKLLDNAGAYINRLMGDRSVSFAPTVPDAYASIFGGKPAAPGWAKDANVFTKDSTEAQQDKFLRDAYDNLKNPNATPSMDEVWAKLAEADFQGDDYAQFWTYIDQRIGQEERTGWDASAGRSAEDIRTFTGMKKVSNG
jgi:hypothetical protein